MVRRRLISLSNSLVIVPWSTGTYTELLNMVEADRAGKINLHDYWNIGDTKTVTLSTMSAEIVAESHASQNVEFVLMDKVCTGFTWKTTPVSNITTPRFIVGMKNSLNEKGYMNDTATNNGGWGKSLRRQWCDLVFLFSLPDVFINIFKPFCFYSGIGNGGTTGLDYITNVFALPPAKCIFGETAQGQTDEAALFNQWEWYTNSNNLIKTVNGIAAEWWESSAKYGNISNFCRVDTSGIKGNGGANLNRGISPFGCI